ncbi:MAG: LacI family transcriptional regulator [Herbiconiux sp.]|uniref:LacI family DNA-binding transcriptional regulator n=1 Tax=Herbiconiux sp. TaxID=1871186 RepID=UPI0011FBFABD|nr:LacI family DNA-binding transcriptional regulator [Herbiconiux sp.]TAJ48311.1 MAG: LacI family transcriptional regulator [Herbiconiux sp.]
MSAPEQARATLLDVAERAGVSRSTASLAFSGAGPVSEATRERVMAAASDLGYGGPDPRARSLRQGRSGVVGIVFDESLLNAFRDPVNVQTLDGIAEGLGLDSNGLLLLTETGAVGTGIQSAAIDAAVLMGCTPVFDRVVDSLGRRGVPIVSIEGGARDGVVDVGLDNAAASETLARHLHDLGHRSVGVVTLGTDVSRTIGLITPEREAGITAAVTADRLEGVRRVFPDAVAYSAGFNLVDDGVRAGRELFAAADAAVAAALPDSPASDAAGGEGATTVLAAHPTAIIAQSDLLAVGVLQVAAERGLRVPDDLSVTGFDGVRIDGLAGVDLTTMRQPAAEKGRAAGLAVTELLAGRPVASAHFECEFHIGDTTGAASTAR